MANFTVSNLNDSGTGSLRAALAAAESTTGDDTVTFATGLSGGVLTLTSGALVINSGTVHIEGDLNGDGAPDVTISGDANGNGVADAGDKRLLEIASGSSVSIDGLTLANGAAFGASFDGYAGDSVGVL